MSSSSQGLASTGLALWAGPALPLHQSSRALSAAVMQIDRAVYKPPPFPSSSNGIRGWASKRTKQGSERKERSRRWGLDEHCCDIVLESEFFFFFLCSFSFTISLCENGRCTKSALVTFCLLLFPICVSFTGVAPAKKSPKLVKLFFFYFSPLPSIHHSSLSILTACPSKGHLARSQSLPLLPNLQFSFVRSNLCWCCVSICRHWDAVLHMGVGPRSFTSVPPPPCKGQGMRGFDAQCELGC